MNEIITIKWHVTQKMTGRSVETGSRCVRLVNMKQEAVLRQTALMLTRTWSACAYEIVITTEKTTK